mmetsp:Transcript_16092/g.50567  ORF Transcript_16092/g.50567 Transcript_16092/m.50567 type:complete len:213 (+) Transcript_16092:576-1214(+)
MAAVACGQEGLVGHVQRYCAVACRWRPLRGAGAGSAGQGRQKARRGALRAAPGGGVLLRQPLPPCDVQPRALCPRSRRPGAHRCVAAAAPSSPAKRHVGGARVTRGAGRRGRPRCRGQHRDAPGHRRGALGHGGAAGRGRLGLATARQRGQAPALDGCGARGLGHRAFPRRRRRPAAPGGQEWDPGGALDSALRPRARAEAASRKAGVGAGA